MAAPSGSGRSGGPNVFIFDHPSQPNDTRLLGGFIQNGSVTEANFLDMLSILLVVDAPYNVIRRGDNRLVTRSQNTLPLGEYEVHCNDYILISNEPWIKRLITPSTSQRDTRFCQKVRARDGRCVFTGIVNQGAAYGRWSGFISAHVYPLEAENIWADNNYSRWITHTEPGQSTINSVQNGFLVRADLHLDWDNYLMSDNYKIVVFGDNNWGVDGRTLDPVCRNPADPRHVPDELLRWHYRQSVFANMRGSGEPVFEHDFPLGSDMMGEIREGPYAKERFEMELEKRLKV
ncbi:hypothetical protein Clacol_003444 [Clathrus columnatus]|uniref:HNH nuclease domain-containing protein n=1 Tax=Clathrus columnatus TaxID=1419009 RepID=A0AAV5A6U0_9AGAM|nr:hypothetical protein Clacol_003444 [Clathrus columnatus]